MEQKLDRQLTAFDEADMVYKDIMSGSTKERPQLKLMLQDLEEGDVVVVKDLDRLSRNMLDLLNIVEEIKRKGATLKILSLNIDTSTEIGGLFLTLLGAFADFERKIILRRTKEGIAVAKTKGKYKGRKPGSIELKGDSEKRFIKFYQLGLSKTDLAKEFNVTRPTIYRWINVLKKRGKI